ncbi:hypothetical protein N9X05_15915 [Paracoccaceae bacterium]|nr:hypothetical protein [Paracoccaceae bacterium]
MPVNIMLDAPLTPIDLETGCMWRALALDLWGISWRVRTYLPVLAPALMM